MTLTVSRLEKSFGEKKAVNQLNLEMDSPGVFGLIGTNGAGKTTAIRCILGIMTPDSGQATWNGQPINRETVSFGYMPEERGIYAKTKVLEQLIYFGMLRGMNKSDAKKSALAYMERLGVLEYKDMLADKLSKGNQQKVQIAATLIHNPQLIFLDEPFSGLDPINTDILRNLIEELVEEGKYIVMSSHQMSVVEEYCRDLVLLHQGKSLLSGNLKTIKKGYGNRNLVVNADERIVEQAKNLHLPLIEKRAEEIELGISNEEEVGDFLKQLIGKEIIPTKYEIKEPSLHEIFIERVGEQK
ncbi:MAG: ATP-binding cassette domain-containing protein [Anaerovoracaceae bacterium]